MLVFEGLMPFISPKAWRSSALRISMLSDSHLRRLGLLLMVLGALMLHWVRIE